MAIVTAHRIGTTVSALAGAYGVSRATVSSILKQEYPALGMQSQKLVSAPVPACRWPSARPSMRTRRWSW